MPDTIEVRNPRTGENDYRICVATDEIIAPMTAALRESQAGWKDAGLDARIGVLQQWKQELVAARDDIVSALSTDTGHTWAGDF